MQKKTADQSTTNTKLPQIKEKDKKTFEELQIEAFSLEFLDGKMNRVAMEHLHKQISSKKSP